MTFEEIKDCAAGIEGWLSEKEGKLLYTLAKDCSGNGVIVEIGSWKGKSTVYLAVGSKNGGNTKVYAVDPHLGFYEEPNKSDISNTPTLRKFIENIKNAGLSDVVVPVVKTSEQAASAFEEPIEFIFIDGLHEYEYVKKDFDLWFPKVADGGIIAFHDTMILKGPFKVIRDTVYKCKKIKKITMVDSITYMQKSEQVTLKDRLCNFFFYLKLNVFGLVIYTSINKYLRLIFNKNE